MARFKYPFFKVDLIYFSVSIDRIGKQKFTVEEMRGRLQLDDWTEPSLWQPQSDLMQLLKCLPNTSIVSKADQNG